MTRSWISRGIWCLCEHGSCRRHWIVRKIPFLLYFCAFDSMLCWTFIAVNKLYSHKQLVFKSDYGEPCMYSFSFSYIVNKGVVWKFSLHFRKRWRYGNWKFPTSFLYLEWYSWGWMLWVDILGRSVRSVFFFFSESRWGRLERDP